MLEALPGVVMNATIDAERELRYWGETQLGEDPDPPPTFHFTKTLKGDVQPVQDAEGQGEAEAGQGMLLPPVFPQ